MSARREAERVYPGCQSQTGPPRRWWRCSYLPGGRDVVSVKSRQKILAAPAIAITARRYDRSRGNLDRPLATSSPGTSACPLSCCRGEPASSSSLSESVLTMADGIVLDLITT